jgi:hypothetical protein
MAASALRRPDDRTTALRDAIGELLGMDEPRKQFAAMQSGLGIRYDLTRADGGLRHPLLGRRMPDLDVVTADGALRVFTLLHDARPLFLDFGAPGRVDVTAWSGRVQLVDATYDGAWQLPVLGEVAAPTAVLIRPDGYVAWVGRGGYEGLTDALTAWFGAPDDALMSGGSPNLRVVARTLAGGSPNLLPVARTLAGGSPNLLPVARSQRRVATTSGYHPRHRRVATTWGYHHPWGHGVSPQHRATTTPANGVSRQHRATTTADRRPVLAHGRAGRQDVDANVWQI